MDSVNSVDSVDSVEEGVWGMAGEWEKSGGRTSRLAPKRPKAVVESGGPVAHKITAKLPSSRRMDAIGWKYSS